MIAKKTTETEYEFGPCSSPHGWHNPEELSPARIMVLAQRSFGKDVDPALVRLVARDEVGWRRNPTSEIRGWGTGHAKEGYGTDLTYYTTTPYGKLPPVTKYAFPECAPKKLVPYSGPQDFPEELKRGSLWLRHESWPEGSCAAVAVILTEYIERSEPELTTATGSQSSGVGCSSGVGDSESAQTQDDFVQPASQPLSHEYESHQVGLPHSAVRDVLGDQQSHPSDRRIGQSSLHSSDS